MNKFHWMAPVALLTLSGWPASRTSADSPSPIAPSQALHSAAESFDEVALKAKEAQLKRNLANSIAQFDALFAADESTRQAWRDYLLWNRWAKPIQSSEDYRADEMERIAWRLYAAQIGFDHPRIVALRLAISDYVTFAKAVAEANGDLPGECQRRLASLRAAAADSTAEGAVGDAAWWLAATGQAQAELAALSADFDHPPVILQVHRELIAGRLGTFQRSSSEQLDKRRNIAGASVSGVTQVSAKTTASLIDDPREVRLLITTTGNVASPHNIATSGRVRVASASTGTFTATSELFWNGQSFGTTPPKATAAINSRIKSIDAPVPFRRAAQRRASASRGSAEREAEAAIASEAEAKMQKQLDVAVEKFNRRAAGFLGFAARTTDPPKRWQTGVTPTAIEIGFVPRAISGVAARPRQMPPLEGEETLGISFHDSAFEQIFRTQLGGKRWTDVSFSHMQRELTGANTHEHLIGLTPERWSVQWDWRQPVSIDFKPDRALLRYRFSQAEVDGYRCDVPFEVQAEMRVLGPPIGLEMHMLQPARVVSLRDAEPLPPQIHSLLERKFRGLFGEKFSLDNLQFPAGGHLDGMSRFRVAGVRHDSQWIHLRYTNRGPNGELLVGDTPGSTLAD